MLNSFKKCFEKEIRRNHNIQIIKKRLIMSDGSFWKESNVLVTGGASFIGSHIVDKLVSYGASVTVLDDLSSGTLENLSQSLDKVKFVTHNLEYNAKDVLKTLFKDQDYVFHMAAIHGGRGYIDTHPALSLIHI